MVVEEKKDDTDLEEKPEDAGDKPEDKKTNEGEGQQLEQEKANAQRAREERDSVQGQLDNAQADLAARQEELDEATGKLDELDAKSKSGELDPLVDDSIKQVVGGLREEIAALTGTVKTLTKETESQKRTAAEAKAQTEHQQRVTRVLETTEKLGDFPVKYRNAALKIADELVDGGKESKPESIEDGILLMSKCYKQAVSNEESKKKKASTATDNGAGGIVFDESGLKRGSHNDVLADMKSSGRFKNAALPQPE